MKYPWFIVGFLSISTAVMYAEDAREPALKAHRPQVSSAAAEVPNTDTDTASFKGRFVTLGQNGLVQIKQPLYPVYKTSQGLMRPYQEVGEPIITKNPSGTYSAMLQTKTYPEGDILDPLPAETVMSGNPYTIVDRDTSTYKPYFSCGHLTTHFEGLPQDKFCGSAAAIDKNLLITAAHNFQPDYINGVSNKATKHRADTVNFEHLLLEPGDRRGSYHIHVASHCYMHPEWEQNFDPKYDIALVFLSQCIEMNEREYQELLQLQVLPESIRGSVRVIGYPATKPTMREASGDMHDGKDSSKVIYHRASTQGGSSGSPIVSDQQTLIGVHAYGVNEAGHNMGVRIRHDLLPFIEESVRLNQLFLEDEAKALGEKAKVMERYEDEKYKKYTTKGKLEGLKEGELQKAQTIAKALINEGMKDDLIVRTTGLTLEKVQALRRGETIQ